MEEQCSSFFLCCSYPIITVSSALLGSSSYGTMSISPTPELFLPVPGRAGLVMLNFADDLKSSAILDMEQDAPCPQHRVHTNLSLMVCHCALVAGGHLPSSPGQCPSLDLHPQAVAHYSCLSMAALKSALQWHVQPLKPSDAAP
eukprot:365496-Chlamydomonas_euryale.AAC.5